MCPTIFKGVEYILVKPFCKRYDDEGNYLDGITICVMVYNTVFCCCILTKRICRNKNIEINENETDLEKAMRILQTKKTDKREEKKKIKKKSKCCCCKKKKKRRKVRSEIRIIEPGEDPQQRDKLMVKNNETNSVSDCTFSGESEKGNIITRADAGDTHGKSKPIIAWE